MEALGLEASHMLVQQYGILYHLIMNTVFLTQIISRRQKSADAKVA